MYVLDFPRLGSGYLSAEASFIWTKDFICGINVCNVDWTLSEYISAHYPLDRLDVSSTNDALEFPS